MGKHRKKKASAVWTAATTTTTTTVITASIGDDAGQPLLPPPVVAATPVADVSTMLSQQQRKRKRKRRAKMLPVDNHINDNNDDNSISSKAAGSMLADSSVTDALVVAAEASGALDNDDVIDARIKRPRHTEPSTDSTAPMIALPACIEVVTPPLSTATASMHPIDASAAAPTIVPPAIPSTIPSIEPSALPPAALPASSTLHIGAGMYDITGPAAEVGMFGYAKAGQLTSGIHMRLRARAFAFFDAIANTRCVFVVADVGMISEWVRQAVVARLQTHPRIPPSAYSLENVMLSATHTHCSPGGTSHYFIYSMHPPLRGADRQNLECVVTGIVEAIARAHTNAQPAVVRVAYGDCLGASVNRSVDAYLANPEAERQQYAHDTDKQMTLWRFDGVDGFPIGMINWFAVHPTSMGNWYTLITGDNKGYAAHMFEKELGTNHLMDRPRAFVAAFAQSNEGDVSPNICGPRHGATQHKDFERMLLVANAQLTTARALYAAAVLSTPLSGGVRVAHQYVEYGKIELTPDWHQHAECPPSTSSGCIGVSMMGGTTFDGRGVASIPEGVTWGDYPKVTTLPQLQRNQKEKPIFFPTARFGLSPAVLPLQLFVLAGCLPLAAAPFEITTMAGRRLRASLLAALRAFGGDYKEPVLAGLSNAYCGYLTTREEYAVQRYEGASTHFGPNQLCATRQQFDALARALCTRSSIPSLAPPRVNGVGVWDCNVPVLHDGLWSRSTAYGHIVPNTDVLREYRPGATVTVSFHAAHPKNNLRTQSTFLEVHRWLVDLTRQPDGGVWVMHADDGDANTFFHWKRHGTFASIVTIEWWIPPTTPIGQYRIKVNGDCKQFLSRTITQYSGVSSTFDVVAGSAHASPRACASCSSSSSSSVGESVDVKVLDGDDEDSPTSLS